MKTLVYDNPYKKINSIGFKAFEAAKAGTTRAKLVLMFDEAEIGHARLLREFKLQNFRHVKWEYSEDENTGKIQIKVTSKPRKDMVSAKDALAAQDVKATPAPVKQAKATPVTTKANAKAKPAVKVAAKPKAKQAAKPKAKAKAKPEAVTPAAESVTVQ